MKTLLHSFLPTSEILSSDLLFFFIFKLFSGPKVKANRARCHIDAWHHIKGKHLTNGKPHLPSPHHSQKIKTGKLLTTNLILTALHMYRKPLFCLNLPSVKIQNISVPRVPFAEVTSFPNYMLSTHYTRLSAFILPCIITLPTAAPL